MESEVSSKVVLNVPGIVQKGLYLASTKIEKGTAEERLAKETSISKSLLALEHPQFKLTFIDDELVFELGQDLVSMYYNNDIFERNTVRAVTATDFVLSTYYENSYEWVYQTAKEFSFEDYDITEEADQAELMCLICTYYFSAKYGKINDLDDIDRPIPLQLFVNVVDKRRGNLNVVYASRDGEVYAGKLTKIKLSHGWFGDMLYANISLIAKGKEGYVTGEVRVPLPMPRKAEKLEDIGLLPLTEERKIELMERGKKYIKYTERPTYCMCSGFAFRPGGWFGDIRLRLNGRVMIDACAMRALNPKVEDEWYCGNPFGDDKETLQEVPEESVWMCVPVVYGFSFMTKDWVRMKIEDVSDIAFSEAAFNELIVPQEYKHIFIASLTHDMPSLDSIEGKGGGKIFLLYGPPGTGKTMTAESVAEVLHKPLYYVTVGELGTNPDSMEVSLNQIMDVAQSWDAVVLLDEVDVFAVKREGSDIHRNAMTAILLRLLERYSGVMFMTTNLKDNLDPAFISRATAVIKYNRLSSDLKAKIWTNLLKKAECLGLPIDQEVYDNVDLLSKNELNGREIKNHIRLAYSVSMASEEKILTMRILDSVIGLRDS